MNKLQELEQRLNVTAFDGLTCRIDGNSGGQWYIHRRQQPARELGLRTHYLNKKGEWLRDCVDFFDSAEEAIQFAKNGPTEDRMAVMSFDGHLTNVKRDGAGKWYLTAKLGRHSGQEPYTHYLDKQGAWHSGGSDRWDTADEAIAFARTGPPKPEPTLDESRLRREQERLRNQRYWKPGELHPNYIDMLAADCGWNPLAVDESMTVTRDGKIYEIKRIK